MTNSSKTLPIDPLDVLTVISGGQTGADLGGLLGAEACGIPTTGWAPRGFKTERGPKPFVLRDRFNLIEHSSDKYPPRTEDNVRDSDLTLIFSTDANSAGTVQTVNLCVKHDKPHITISEFDEQTRFKVLAFLQCFSPRIINIAGNRESKSKGLSATVRDVLKLVLPQYRHDLVTYHQPELAKLQDKKKARDEQV